MRDPRIPSQEVVDTLAAELEAQPAILRTLAERWESPDPSIQDLMTRRHRRVALVALGSSRDAALVGQWLLRSRGVDATVHMPSEDLEPLAREALVIAVSASGATGDIAEAIDRLARRRPVIAVTREPGSPVAALADVVVPLGCEPERSGIAVWSFLATIAALSALSELMTGGSTASVAASLRDAAPLLAEMRASQAASIERFAERLREASMVHIVAPMSRLGPALQAAQVLREVPRLNVVAVAAEDWDHSHAYLTVDAGYLAVVSGPTSADAELRRWVVGRGRGLLSLGQPIVEDGPGLTMPDDPRLRVLVECPLMESIALRAWAMLSSP